MGQSVSQVLEPSHDVEIFSTRNDPPPTHTITKEFGVVVAYNSEFHNQNPDQLTQQMEKAKGDACLKCHEKGGNALLATKIQLSPKDDKQHTNIVQIIGTCVKVAAAIHDDDGDRWTYLNKPRK